MHRGADTAHPLGDGPRIARIAPDQNLLQAAHHSAGAEGVGDDAILHHRFNAQVAFNASYRIDNNSWHSSSRLFLIFGVNFGDDRVLAYVRDDGVRGNPGERGQTHGRANGVCRALDTEAGEPGKVLIERAVVPEAWLAAANAAMTRLNR